MTTTRAIAQALLARTPDRLVPAAATLRRLLMRHARLETERWRTEIRRTEALSEDQLAAWQFEQLRDQVHHAYDNVPFYRRSFDAVGASPHDLRDVSDLSGFPTVTKSDLQEHLTNLLATNVPSERRYYVTSGGSTGIPVGFYHDPDQPWRERAFISELWRRVGHRQGDPSVVLRGTVVPGGRLWHRDPLNAALIVSSYHLDDDHLPLMLERIRRFRPRFLQAYPSAATIVARHMLRAGEPPIEGLSAVLCGSENLYAWQRRVIEAAFGCRVYSWYGQSEAVCLAGECEHSSSLHVFPQYGVVELVDNEGRLVTEPGRIGEVVATSLARRAMPLVRYRTMDAAVLGARSCDACGRPYPLLERIEGRLHEFIISGRGRIISMAAINMHSPVFDNVSQFRFAQNVAGHVVLRVVPRGSFDATTDGGRIKAELGAKLGDDTTLELVVVDEIPRPASGKLHFIDQELPSPYSAAP